MSALIEDFKREHSEIIRDLKEVKKLGIVTKEGQAKLMSTVVDLLKHLWDEDEKLYPVLRKASGHNKKLKEILSFFVNGLGAIYEDTLNFLTKYSKGAADGNFQREYGRLFDALSKRVGYEETVLFGEYEKIEQ